VGTDKDGRAGAPDDMALAPVTQVWLVTSDDPAATVSGRYFYHQREQVAQSSADGVELQEGLLAACGELSGVELR